MEPVRSIAVEPAAGASPAPGERAPGGWHWRARRALARFGDRAVPAFSEALGTADDPAVRQLAADSLGRLGPEAGPALPVLRRAAQHDRDAAVRAAAAAALAALEGRGRRPEPR